MILLWDQAGFHRAWQKELIAGIELFPLPPYTPQLQPVEQIWPLLREAIAKKVFDTLEHLQEVLIKHIVLSIKRTEKFRRLNTLKIWGIDMTKTMVDSWGWLYLHVV